MVTAAAATTLAGVAVILERTALASPHYHGPVSDQFNDSQFTAGDDVLIMELGTSHADQGMSRVTTWLLQHPPRQ